MQIKAITPEQQKTELVNWKDNMSVGIKTLDGHHQELLKTTNALFLSCLNGEDEARDYFKLTIHKIVEYVKEHFRCEEKLFDQIGFPHKVEHRAHHEKFIKEVLVQVNNFESGGKFVPNRFARFLQDWILTHIAIDDKKYGAFCAKKRAEGVIIPLE